MMTVFEYAEDVNKSVNEIIKKCEDLGIEVEDRNSSLSDEAITELDSVLENEEVDYDALEELDEKAEELTESSKIDADNNIQTQKLKKKSVNIQSKKELANKKKEMYKNKEKLTTNAPITNDNVILYSEDMSVKELADKLGVKTGELIKKLFNLGMMATVNNAVSFEHAELLVIDYGKELKNEATADVTNFEEFEVVDNEKDLTDRPPVVTIMGHVDHGKTTLLDTIRKTNVADGEAGGITQAISAYQVEHEGKKITFIDTPGHAAFTEMRARGASITDIVIIIVAADDGIMPQTREAIDHAKAAGVPILVAINKMDKPGANPERIMTELSEAGLMPDEWGGDTLYTKISALTGDNIDELLANVVLISEMEAYKANPNRYAIGTVVESRLDRHLGPVTTVLIQNGTLRLGDPIVVGSAYGKIRTLRNDLGKEIMEAYPAQPVEITGLNDVPEAGDKFMAFETEKEARNVGEQRKETAKLSRNVTIKATSLEDLFAKMQTGVKKVNIVIKADVNGSAEAVKGSLEKIEVEGASVNIVRTGVGAITEGDVILAKAGEAIIIGFNVRPNAKVRAYAKDNGVELRLYSIIYKAVEEMEAAMKGMLDPVYEEKITGTAEVRQLFKFSKVGVIAGSFITDGVIKTSSKSRIIRDGIVIYDGDINSIQREKNQVKEVKKGLECGITIENYTDIKEGDVIEAYEMIEIKK